MSGAAPHRPGAWLARARASLAEIDGLRFRGRVVRAAGLGLEVLGVPAQVGEIFEIERMDGSGSMLAEAVGFRDGRALLLPLEDTSGIGSASRVEPLGRSLDIVWSPRLLGRVLDGLGRPIDGRGPLPEGARMSVRRDPPPALRRRMIEKPLPTGVSAIDALLTFGRGQRVGVLAGPGIGKSTLMGKIARDAQADVVVVCLVGERGREVRQFLELSLGEHGLARAVVVAATSDTPPLQRFAAPLVATTIAECFRDEGRDVLLLMDSATRFAAAVREIGLAAGEPPTTKGYPPSLYAHLPRLVERLGTAERGSITSVITVLVEGDDLADPVADAMMSLLDGHVVLSRELARRNHYPAIDVLTSVSRTMGQVVEREHARLAARFNELWSAYTEAADLLRIGAYRPGGDPVLDAAVQSRDAMLRLLRQPSRETRSFEQTLALLAEAVGSA
ncbi:MAG: FliI/YscN family ATPase [Planctomycetota bacterium]|nr:MAG: FliI/YscN family ATPase [Planctomycetota bacterium]